MPRTSCSQPLVSHSSSISGLLSLIQPPQHPAHSATSILHSAVRSQANDHSASPLVRDLSSLERRLAQLADATGFSDGEWEAKVGEQLAAMCDVLQRVDASTVARPVHELFPQLDALLLSLLPPMSGRSASSQTLLLSCCALLTRAATRTAAAATWPRWLQFSPTRAVDSDKALTDSLTSMLTAADPDPALLFASSALLASLCSSSSHATAVVAYLSQQRLLPALGRLYHQQCNLVAQRVQSLMERGQRRLLDDMCAEAGQQEWLLGAATDNRVGAAELSDRQQLLMLSRLQTVIEAAIRCGRHAPRLKPACDLCSTPALLSGLLAAVTSLWECLLSAVQHSPSSTISERVRGLSLSALSLLYEATYKSKQQPARPGGTAEVVGHISVTSQLLDPASATSTVFYPLLLTAVQQLVHWLPDSPLMCTGVLSSVASAVLELAMAQRHKNEARASTPPARPPVDQPASERRLDLSPLMHALLAAATQCLQVVRRQAVVSAELLDKVDGCMQATLEAHAYFFRHTALTDVTGMPDFLLRTCSSLVPLACCLLSLTTAATGQSLSAVAVMAVNLERLVEGCEQWHVLHQLLACAIQHGLIRWSWSAREVLQRLRTQHQSQSKDNGSHVRQLDTALRCFDKFLSKLMAAMEWWSQGALGQHQRSERWMAAFGTLFGGQSSCLALIESLHSYPSWRTAADTSVSDQLFLVTTLSIALLFTQPLDKHAGELREDDQKGPDATLDGQQLVVDCTRLVTSIEQLLIEEKHKQSSSNAIRPTVLSQSALLHLCLLLLLIERLHRHCASTRAKSALFGFLAASDVSAADLVVSPPLQCCITATSPGHWLWQQSTANHGVVLLHDQLLSSVLRMPSESRPGVSRPSPSSASTSAGSRIDRIHQQLSVAAEALASVEAAGPLQALVRRWRAVVQRWRDSQVENSTASTDVLPRRSEEVEELLLCTAYLMDGCAHKLATLDLLEPLTLLLTSDYHGLLSPTIAALDNERLFPAVDVAAWLLHALASLLAAAPAPRLLPLAQLERAFDAACRLLFVFTGNNAESLSATGHIMVGRGCVQLMNAVISYAATAHYGPARLLRSLTSYERSCEAMAQLVQTGFSPELWTGATSAVTHRALRVHLPRASNAGCEELLQLCRLQLQVECMRLCTTLLLSSTDVAYAMLTWEQCTSVLSHACDEMKAAAFHYLAACFNCHVLRFGRSDGGEGKYDDEDEDEDGIGWTPTEKDMPSAHVLLLAVQACLYPRQRLSLSSAALDVLEAMLHSSTAAQKRELLDQPWHTFVVQSCLLALAMRPSGHATADERDRRVCQLHRYLYLLTSEEGQDSAVQRYLKDVDSRLLQPLLFFPAIDDQPASQPPAVVCSTSVYHYLTMLQRLDRAHLLLPIRLRAQLPAHLRLVERVVRASGTATACPAAVVRPVEEEERQVLEGTAAAFASSGGQSQPSLQSQQCSASQPTEKAWTSAGAAPRSAVEVNPHKTAPFVTQCVCSGGVEGAELVTEKCKTAIGKLQQCLEH